MARNRKGQMTREKPLEIKITKRIQEVADEVGVRIRPLIRDMAAQELRSAIYNSYAPATKSGQETKNYNETHKHQKATPYHHIGLLASKIDAIIDGDTIKTIIREATYPDGASTTEVYDILKFGTTKTSKKKGFYYNNHKDFSPYISQPPHNFETRANERIEEFLNNVKSNPELYLKPYLAKYKNKRI